MNKEILCPPLPTYEDERGRIEVIVDGEPFKSVLRIVSKKSAVRANHYHQTDYHYCILESGKMEYYERPVGSKETPVKIVVGPGQVFYTKPMAEHAMKFLEDSVLWCFSRNSRSQANYETDTIRVPLIKS